MSNQQLIRKIMDMYIVLIITILFTIFFVVAGDTLQSAGAGPHLRLCSDAGPGVARCHIVSPAQGVPMAISGTNLYMAWPNNHTGHWNVFFGKSMDGGKTFKTVMLSAPNKGNIIDRNTQSSASGSNVYVTWWTNKTGTLMPVFRASNDNGNTFGPIIKLNSTSTSTPVIW